jgi:PAS domain S-box-containing protein
MAEQRKTYFILALASSLVLALGALVFDDEVREKLGPTYYVIALAIIACVLLVLAGYAWDRNLLQRLRALHRSVPEEVRSAATDPEPDEIISLARNIERMARTLQKTEASYRGIVEDQVDLICRYRPDGRLTFANNAYADAFGRRRPDLIGVNFPLLVPGTALGVEPYTFERELEFADGSRRWLLWTQRPIRDEGGDILEYQSVGHDITLRKEAEAALVHAKEAAEAADRAKSEFLALVGDEIRAPVHGVISLAQVLAQSSLSAQQREQVELIKSSGLALEKLISDILDLARLEASRVVLVPAPFALHRAVDDTVAHFHPQAEAAALLLSRVIDGDVPPVVQGDIGRIRQILDNLVSNALKFTERGQVKIHVSCTRGEPLSDRTTRRAVRLYFAVSDTGIGIPAERIARLFTPFSRREGTADGRQSGTGLGLVIARRLCELMGGTMSVESKPGAGSTFRFSVLLDYERGDTAAPFAAKPPPAT